MARDGVINFKGDEMKITGMQSICCGAGVRYRLPYADKATLKNEKHLYVCFKCKRNCDMYYVAEIRN